MWSGRPLAKSRLADAFVWPLRQDSPALVQLYRDHVAAGMSLESWTVTSHLDWSFAVGEVSATLPGLLAEGRANLLRARNTLADRSSIGPQAVVGLLQPGLVAGTSGSIGEEEDKVALNVFGQGSTATSRPRMGRRSGSEQSSSAQPPRQGPTPISRPLREHKRRASARSQIVVPTDTYASATKALRGGINPLTRRNKPARPRVAGSMGRGEASSSNTIRRRSRRNSSPGT